MNAEMYPTRATLLRTASPRGAPFQPGREDCQPAVYLLFRGVVRCAAGCIGDWRLQDQFPLKIRPVSVRARPGALPGLVRGQ
jgi:hypothetical protein